jgi:hypothetical protein
MAPGGLSRDFNEQVAEEPDLGDHHNLHFNTDTLKDPSGPQVSINAQHRTEASYSNAMIAARVAAALGLLR